MSIKLNESQLRAVEMAATRRFAIVNGGAGTGKTTIVKAITEAIGPDRVELCTFAGKAAARLREATGHPASTIHSMLRYMGEELGFTRKTLAGRTVILDEASMVNSSLMAEICKRRPDRFILVGDEAQLPPVGSGQPFHDLVRLMPQAVCTLTTCYRNSEAIYRAAMAVRVGEQPTTREQTDNELWEFHGTGDERYTHDSILKEVRAGAVDFDRDIILCCRNGEDATVPCSVEGMNKDIKDIVNPGPEDDARPESRRIDAGDRVICTKNNPDIDCWNGTTGKVIDLDADGGMFVKLDYPATGRDGMQTSEVLVPRKRVPDWQLAYALTIHKSQGSQYRKVLLVCNRRDTAMLLDRSMLYTAITRAKAECHGYGSFRAMVMAIGNVAHKATVIQELVAQEGRAL